MGKKETKAKKTITVSGVTFSAEQVKNATVTIDGRDVYIGEREEEARSIGFQRTGGD